MSENTGRKGMVCMHADHKRIGFRGRIPKITSDIGMRISVIFPYYSLPACPIRLPVLPRWLIREFDITIVKPIILISDFCHFFCVALSDPEIINNAITTIIMAIACKITPKNLPVVDDSVTSLFVVLQSWLLLPLPSDVDEFGFFCCETELVNSWVFWLR